MPDHPQQLQFITHQAGALLKQLTYGLEPSSATQLQNDVAAACTSLKFNIRHERLAFLLANKGIKVSASQLIVLAGGGSKKSAVLALQQRRDNQQKPAISESKSNHEPQDARVLSSHQRDYDYLSGEIKMLKVQLDSARQTSVALERLLSEAVDPNRSLTTERRNQIAHTLAILESMRGRTIVEDTQIL